MPFCTLVEFEWDESFGREQFTAALGEADLADELPRRLPEPDHQHR